MTVTVSNRSLLLSSGLGLRSFLTGLLVLCVLMRSASASCATSTTLSVNWSSGKLSVSAVRAPLDTVLAEIARRTGLVVITTTPSRRQLSVNFSGLPLRRALAQLMSRENYAIVQRPGAGGGEPVLVVMILGPAPAKSASPSISTAPAGAFKDHLATLLDTIHKGGANADQALREGVSDSDPNVRTLALQTLGERGGNAGADALSEAARAAQPATRLAALEVLGEHGDVDPVPRLTAALRDPDPEVKGYAMQMLLQNAGPQAVQALRQAFNSDPDPSFRAFIGEALSSYNASHTGNMSLTGP